MADKDIIFFSGVDWDGKRELPVHHVARLLSNNNRVFLIDNFGGIRGLTLKDLPRVLHKLRRIFSRQLAGAPPETMDSNNRLTVFQPFVIPVPRLPNTVGRLNVRLLRRALKTLIHRHDISDPIIWTRVPSDTVWNAIANLPRSALIYQSVDKISNSPMVPNYARPRLEQYERLFTMSADLIFTSANGLYEEKQKSNPNTYFFPNGVDPILFSRNATPNEHLKQLPHPIIGFVGSLGPWVDYDLIQQAASITPEWSYVIVGPVNAGIDLRPLQALPNVHLTGAVPHAELPSYLATFDCGLIPYSINDFTRYTFPSKMAEYLAVGLPVVSTRLPELAPYAHVVSCVEDAEGLVQAVRSYLGNTSPEKSREERIRVAQSLSWESLVSGMEQAIENSLSSRKRSTTQV
jgi:glycosyltransferase involved in cell wall biosynthesis